MGLFDWVVGVPEIKCICGVVLEGWQTKELDCEMEKVHFSRVSKFYTICDGCGSWHELKCRTGKEQNLSTPLEGGPSFSDFQHISRRSLGANNEEKEWRL